MYSSLLQGFVELRNLEEHWKAEVRGEIEKSGMADHIWKEKGNHLPSCGEEHWMIRRLQESAHMLGYSDLLSKLSVEMNTVWEPIIKKVRLKKNEYDTSNESYVIVLILVM